MLTPIFIMVGFIEVISLPFARFFIFSPLWERLWR